MSQAKNKNKFALAGSSACPAAVDARWIQIRRFGFTPERGTVFCPLMNINRLFSRHLYYKLNTFIRSRYVFNHSQTSMRGECRGRHIGSGVKGMREVRSEPSSLRENVRIILQKVAMNFSCDA